MAGAPSFSDIGSHWAKACILALANRNLVQGYPDGTFRPNGTITRAEYAVLMYGVFPNTKPVRSTISFPDVPRSHWAYSAIQWGYERGLFSGYPDGTFKPNQAIPRMQAVLVLVTATHLNPPQNVEETLNLYYDDATQIPGWTRWAIAAATQANLVVDYPDVRQFRPTPSITRGEVCAFLCRALNIPDAVPAQYATWAIGLYGITGSVTVPFAMWKGSARLMRDMQVRLSEFRLYPSNQINGQYTSQTEQALTQFCDFYGLPTMKVGVFDQKFASALINADAVAYIMAQARDRQQVFSDYLQQEAGFDADKLAFLDRGVQDSSFQATIPNYPSYLIQKPDGQSVASLGGSAVLTGTGATVFFSTYPSVGTVPQIDSTGLDFLSADIQQACVCAGSFVNGQINAHWLGKNALSPAQLWSSTKIIPLLNVVCQANAVQPTANVRNCLVRPIGDSDGYGFYNLAVDLVSYQDAIASSNSIAATFKQFSTLIDLENWVKGITGNSNLQFQGRYGEPPFIQSPDLWSQTLNTTLLQAPDTSHTGNNALSTYDLARFISMLGWHYNLPPAARLPNAQWNSLETVVRAMGMDTARYLDVAIDKLGLAAAIESPVIISKLGFGRSDTRNQTELAYVALFQFVDKRPRAQGKPGILRTVGMALLGAKALGDANEEARQLDAQMAAEVTEILRRIATQELA